MRVSANINFSSVEGQVDVFDDPATFSSCVIIQGTSTFGNNLIIGNACTKVILKDNESNALTFDTVGKCQILKFQTTDSSEKVIVGGTFETSSCACFCGNTSIGTGSQEITLNSCTITMPQTTSGGAIINTGHLSLVQSGVNKYVGINTSTPTQALEVCGTVCGASVCATTVCGTTICGTSLCGTTVCGTTVCGTKIVVPTSAPAVLENGAIWVT
jgi:hypothetical protein